MEKFKMATEVHYGQGSLNEIKHFEMEKVAIICDPFMEKSQKVDLVTNILKDMNCRYQVFAEVVPDPTIEVVTKGLISVLSVQPDTIIALGGGSALDTAKAVRQIYQKIVPDTKVKLICIPTTSGTGSEVTSFAVISDPKAQAKYALVDETMIPDVAILDSEFTLSVPTNVTADTGMDVLTHTLEAYVSTQASDFTDACGEKAMKIVWENLTEVVRDGNNHALREKIHNASCLAGMAFNEASLGICHSLAHALGGRFHIPHGRANAMLLPHVIAYNAELDSTQDTPSLLKYELAAKNLGIQAGTSRATVHGLIAGINRQLKQLGLPKTVNEFGIDEAEYAAAIPEMAEKALKDRCTITNPRNPSQKDLEELYMRLCKGGY